VITDGEEPASSCPHTEFDALVEVDRIEDSGRFQADIRIWCRDCGMPMRFKSRTTVALDLDGLGLSVDQLELRAAIEPREPSP
jgi:hypothetical protein